MDNQLIEDTLRQLLEKLSFDVQKIEVTQGSDALHVNVTIPEPSKLIGWHGETLNSMQHILKSVIWAQAKLDKPPFLLLDTDGYRNQQEDKVRAIAERKIDFVRRTGSRVALAPMNPYFRRVVHTFIAENKNFEDCTTESIGQGDYRQVVLRLKDEKNKPKQEDASAGEELSPVMADEDDLGNLDV